MPSPGLRRSHEGPSMEQLQEELHVYVKQMTKIYQAIYLQEQQRASRQEPEEEQEILILPDDQVYITFQQ